MKVVDANVLLYAVNTDAAHHERSRRWLDDALGGAETVGFAWIALLAFVRLTTKAEVFSSPLTVDDALDRVDAWLAAPSAVVVEPGRDHAALVRRLLTAVGTGANLVNDAHLAALAIEQRGSVVSFDKDFDRFPVIRQQPPEV